ncbi:MAG: alpha-amylase family glycosyl hydrolase [Myxococcota bacterium]
MSSLAIGQRWSLALALLTVACGPPDITVLEDRCAAAIWGQPRRPGERLTVVGSWDGWATPVSMRDFEASPWQVAEMSLPPGVYEYLVVEEGASRIDEHNALTNFRASDGLEVSRLDVASCAVPQVQVLAVHEGSPDGFEVELGYVPARDGAALDLERTYAELEDGTALTVEQYDEDAQTFRVRASGQARGKHRVRVHAADGKERPAVPVTAVGWVDPVAPQWSDGIVYQIMIDRFRGDGGVQLEPPPDPGARAGGTLDGVLSELRAGTFEALGVSALWLSPVYKNPVEAREGRDDDHLYEGYHGYWPLDTRAVDERIGGEDALDALVAEAHARGIRVLLDLVPNHLYEDNPRVAAHRGEGWFHEHEPECVCGTPSCPWGEFIQVCWFTDYLPDLRFQNPDVMELAVEDALWWHDRFDTDGFRIDAVPMMPRAVSRRIVHAMRDSTGPRSAAFSMGEIFTGPGAGGTEIIRYHLGPDGLDSAFDFPLMWVIRDVLAHRTADMSALESSLSNTEQALAGSGAVLGTMIGNHDVTRFASEAEGNAGGDPWSAPPTVPTDEDVYVHTGLGLGLVLTLPGLPVIYYGDELGLAGGRDPDNRRVMPDLSLLNPAQVDLLNQVQALAQLRRCLPALRSGTRTSLLTERDVYAFLRDSGDSEPAVVVLSRDADPATVQLPAGSTPVTGWYKDAVSGQRFEITAAGAAIEMEPRSLRVLVPETSSCG